MVTCRKNHFLFNRTNHAACPSDSPGGQQKKKKPFVSEGRACNVVLFPRGESYQPQTHSQASHQMNGFAISDCVRYGTSSGPEEQQPAVIVIFNCQLSHHPHPTGVRCSCQNEQQNAGFEDCWCLQKGQYTMTCSKTNKSFGYCAIQLHEHVARIISPAFNAVQGASQHVYE